MCYILATCWSVNQQWIKVLGGLWIRKKEDHKRNWTMERALPPVSQRVWVPLFWVAATWAQLRIKGNPHLGHAHSPRPVRVTRSICVQPSSLQGSDRSQCKNHPNYDHCLARAILQIHYTRKSGQSLTQDAAVQSWPLSSSLREHRPGGLSHTQPYMRPVWQASTAEETEVQRGSRWKLT